MSKYAKNFMLGSFFMVIRERGNSVVECSTQDRGVAVLCP